MWWWIGGIALAVVLFIGWIIWELLHAPLIGQDLLDGLACSGDYDDEEDDSEGQELE